MGWFKKTFKKVGRAFKDPKLLVGSMINPVALGGTALEFGGDIIGAKYQSDQQSRLNRENANWQAEENLRAFNRNIERADFVYNRDIERADSVWAREQARYDQLWHRNNEYNSPEAQMERFRKAGLSPLLAYTQGNSGNAAMAGSSQIGTVRGESGSVEPARREPSRFELKRRAAADTFFRYIQIQAQNLMMENIKAQNQVIKQQSRFLDARRRTVEEDIKARKRENKIFDKSGTSMRDPWWMRIGGRSLEGFLGDIDFQELGEDADDYWPSPKYKNPTIRLRRKNNGAR